MTKQTLNSSLGPLMIDVAGFELTAEDKEILAHPAVCGVIIFAKNFESVEQISELNRQIKQVKSKNNSNNSSHDNSLLISIDQEGGTVQRIKEPLTVLPSMSELGKYYEYDQKAALSLTKQLGWLLASELLVLGFDFSFTPVVDLNICDNKIIKLRAFHKKADIVSELALALKHGLNQAGMAAVAKHFPGHGGVELDSHELTPVDSRQYSELENHDLIPFKKLIEDNLEAVMTSHIVFNNIDKNITSFSKFWLHEILREKLNFNGLIVSDDLNMHGANFIVSSKVSEKQMLSHTDRVATALEAGCDLILLCNNRESVVATLDNWHQFNWTGSTDYTKRLNNMRAKARTFGGLDSLKHDQVWQAICNNLDKLKIASV